MLNKITVCAKGIVLQLNIFNNTVGQSGWIKEQIIKRAYWKKYNENAYKFDFTFALNNMKQTQDEKEYFCVCVI